MSRPNHCLITHRLINCLHEKTPKQNNFISLQLYLDILVIDIKVRILVMNTVTWTCNFKWILNGCRTSKDVVYEIFKKGNKYSFDFEKDCCLFIISPLSLCPVFVRSELVNKRDKTF